MVRIQDRTFDFAVRILNLCKVLEDDPGVGRTISWQLSRSGTSVGANIQEAQSAQSTADFIAKMFISLKEARETLYWLRLIADTKTLPAEQISNLTEEADKIVGVLNNIIRSKKRNAGPRKQRK